VFPAGRHSTFHFALKGGPFKPSFGLSGAVPPLGIGCQKRNGNNRRSRSKSARALGIGSAPQSTRLPYAENVPTQAKERLEWATGPRE
jgi:hypothetical protein